MLRAHALAAALSVEPVAILQPELEIPYATTSELVCLVAATAAAAAAGSVCLVAATAAAAVASSVAATATAGSIIVTLARWLSKLGVSMALGERLHLGAVQVLAQVGSRHTDEERWLAVVAQRHARAVEARSRDVEVLRVHLVDADGDALASLKADPGRQRDVGLDDARRSWASATAR